MKNFYNNLKDIQYSFNNNEFDEEEIEDEYSDIFNSYEKLKRDNNDREFNYE